jgi:molybdate transport system ATP-binding protein
MHTESGLQQAIQQVKNLMHLKTADIILPAPEQQLTALSAHERQQPLIRLTKAPVKYTDKIVFQGLNWTIYPNQHWQVYGPNGSGKTCLLNLLTGDHPQCYVNDIFIFGYQRGSGESIWQIKQHIGMLSNGFHLDYRVNCSALDVILSGFYDSVGLYQTPTKRQQEIGAQWLAVLDLAVESGTPFQQLSHGDQRLLLIARAMVKHPKLLILDEPCNGLDEINRLKVLSLIELIASQGTTTLLYVSHYLEDQIPSIKHQLNMTDFN